MKVLQAVVILVRYNLMSCVTQGGRVLNLQKMPDQSVSQWALWRQVKRWKEALSLQILNNSCNT